MIGSCDPYIVLTYGGKEAKTSVKKRTLDAEWNEKFVLNHVAPEADGSLEVRCMDWDMARKNEMVGRYVLTREELEKLATRGGDGEKVELVLVDGEKKTVYGKDKKASVVELKVKMLQAPGSKDGEAKGADRDLPMAAGEAETSKKAPAVKDGEGEKEPKEGEGSKLGSTAEGGKSQDVVV
eukprot:CAMPEP_0181289012 /NCGR_PEP_ID=MMETSP1101-20121128/653_1 /TAXON_ID=46948 /ORGANISM="Rhodomonas abbreviata, Strain Caron Lab Isolate" /LENGTH=180 /DNA_ID=CAMNT_0023393201 /DNA_START=27 /DNA_END=565 /DNA_ORIENTATION=+